jgi:hypothetical protein
MLHRGHDPSRQVTTIGVMPHLMTLTQNMQRILTLHNLLHQIRHHMRHRQLHIAGQHLGLTQGTTLTHTDTVERPHDRERQLVLLPRRPRVILHRQLLKPVRRQRRRNPPLVTLLRRPLLSRLEHHRRRHVGDLLQPAIPMRRNRRVTRRRHDPLIGRQQVIGVGVEIRNPTDHRRTRDEMITIRGQLGNQPGIPRITLDKPVRRIVVIAVRHRPVLGKVVQPDHLVATAKQLLHHIATDEPGRTGNQDLSH